MQAERDLRQIDIGKRHSLLHPLPVISKAHRLQRMRGTIVPIGAIRNVFDPVEAAIKAYTGFRPLLQAVQVVAIREGSRRFAKQSGKPGETDRLQNKFRLGREPIAAHRRQIIRQAVYRRQGSVSA